VPSSLRTDQVGSLIRPQRLLDARAEYHAGRITRDQLTAVEDSCILEALDLQRKTGIDVLTDGEMRRDAFMTGLSENVEGFVEKYPVAEQTRPDGTKVMVQSHGKAVQGKLRPLRRLHKRESDFMLKHAAAPFKITLISPPQVAFSGYRVGLTDKAYPSHEDLTRDLVQIIGDEMRALASEGVTYMQLDEGLARFSRDGWREDAIKNGEDPDKELAAAIAAENECWDSLPAGVTKAMHVCRGNRTTWGGGRGGYEWIAEQAFNDLHVDRFVLEYDTDRAGGFEPLRFVPRGRVVALGLVSTKVPALESQDDLLRRIDEASKYCPVEQLALCPQCGFQSSAMPDGRFITMDDQQRKLELIVDTARKVWG
jgi:5-methyltetrahydropteroyltriglutamate--homocysteine methyltransferase